MDPFDREFFEKYTPSNQDDIRTAMGHTRRYAERIGLASMVPWPDVASTGYVLASPPTEHLIYQPQKGKSTVELETGSYRYKWFQPDRGQVVAQGLVQVKRANRPFQPPFAADVQGKQIHVILQVWGNNSIVSMYDYRRVVIDVAD